MLAIVLMGGAAQTVNVNFGDAATDTPAPTYAAAGDAGTWNTVSGVAGMTFHLVATDGAAGITLTQTPTTTLLATTDPSVTGDDAKLLNHGLVTTGAETCLMFDGMAPGSYEVLIYAWTPDAPTVLSRTRQDEAPSTIDVGGAWTGAFAEGVTHARYVVTVDQTGQLPAHSGLAPGQPSAALNAIQIRPLSNNPDAGVVGPDAGEPAGGGGDAATGPAPHHSGGCSSSGGAGLPVAFALLALARRRRR